MNNDLKEEALKAEASALFASVFRGSHHHGPLRDDRKTFKVHASFARGAATYDDDTLTRFVLICHEQGWRGAIRPGGPYGLVFMITKRARIEDRPEEEMSAVHPTLQQAVECLESGGHWGTYWRSIKAQETGRQSLSLTGPFGKEAAL